MADEPSAEQAPVYDEPDWIEVVQIRSAISEKPKARGTLRALGLRGPGSRRTHQARPEIYGMLHRVSHLVTFTERSSVGKIVRVTPALTGAPQRGGEPIRYKLGDWGEGVLHCSRRGSPYRFEDRGEFKSVAWAPDGRLSLSALLGLLISSSPDAPSAVIAKNGVSKVRLIPNHLPVEVLRHPGRIQLLRLDAPNEDDPTCSVSWEQSVADGPRGKVSVMFRAGGEPTALRVLKNTAPSDVFQELRSVL